jgi:hypothetical protein
MWTLFKAFFKVTIKVMVVTQLVALVIKYNTPKEIVDKQKPVEGYDWEKGRVIYEEDTFWVRRPDNLNTFIPKSELNKYTPYRSLGGLNNDKRVRKIQAKVYLEDSVAELVDMMINK